MTPREMQSSFELEVNRFDSELLVESHIIFYWLNESQEAFTKDTYSDFEQSQKDTEDLRTLIVEGRIATVAGTTGVNKPNSYTATFPAGYFITLGEEAEITIPVVGTYRTAITDCDLNTYTRVVEDPYSKHNLHYEKAYPLRLTYQDTVELISDGQYTVDFYNLRYLKLPYTIELEGLDCELPEHVHTIIVQEAVKLFLASQE